MDTVQLYHEFLNLMESCDYEVHEVHEPDVHCVEERGRGVHHGLYDVYGETDHYMKHSPSKYSPQSSPIHYDTRHRPQMSPQVFGQLYPYPNIERSPSRPTIRDSNATNPESNITEILNSASHSSTNSSHSSTNSSHSSTNSSHSSTNSDTPSSTNSSNSSTSSSSIKARPINRNSNLAIHPIPTCSLTPVNSPCNSCLSSSFIKLTGLVDEAAESCDEFDDDDDLYYSEADDPVPGLFPSMDIQRDFMTFEQLPLNPSYVD